MRPRPTPATGHDSTCGSDAAPESARRLNFRGRPPILRGQGG
jgi:hypothetical protein